VYSDEQYFHSSSCSPNKQGTLSGRVTGAITEGCLIRLGKAFLVYFPETRKKNE
jgi:hypothetical protein